MRLRIHSVLPSGGQRDGLRHGPTNVDVAHRVRLLRTFFVRRLLMLAGAFMVIVGFVLLVPDLLAYHYMPPVSLPRPSALITRGAQYDARIDDFGHRLTLVEESQQKIQTFELETKVADAVMQAKVSAMFELMR